MLPLERKTFCSPIRVSKWTPFKISFGQCISNKAILYERDNTGYDNCVGEGKYGLITIIFGGGHLEIQDGRHVFCSTAPQRFNLELIFSGSAYIVLGSRKQKDRLINCFAVAILKFKMATALDLISSITRQRVVMENDFKVSVCTAECKHV